MGHRAVSINLANKFTIQAIPFKVIHKPLNFVFYKNLVNNMKSSTALLALFAVGIISCAYSATNSTGSPLNYGDGTGKNALESCTNSLECSWPYACRTKLSTTARWCEYQFCNSDASCGAGLSCNVNSICVPYPCNRNGANTCAVGFKCDDYGGKSSGSILEYDACVPCPACECNTDTDCSGSEKCNSRSCVECLADTDCDGKWTCENEICVKPPLNLSLIIGISVGAAVLIAIIILVVCLCMRKTKKKSPEAQESGTGLYDIDTDAQYY